MISPQLREKLISGNNETLRDSCQFGFRKGAGPGGQKINKTSSAVRVFHPETGLSASASESRSQNTNRLIALKKLRFRIACRERCGADRSFTLEEIPSTKNPARYFLWIAALFDHLAETDWDLRIAAKTLGVSRSRLTRLIRRDPDLWREYLLAASRGKKKRPGQGI